MLSQSPILKALADRYRKSQAGRTGDMGRAFGVDYRELLKAARSEDGAALTQAERDLREAREVSGRRLDLDTPSRDASIIHRVVLSRDGGEDWLFAFLGEESPTQKRGKLSALFASFVQADVPDRWTTPWRQWCSSQAEKALKGGPVEPFSREDLADADELLSVLVRVVNWKGESLIRFASCTLCGDSKLLEQLQRRLETCLKQIGVPGAQTFEDLGLLEKPRQVMVHGPLRLELPEGILHLGWLRGATALSETDLQQATAIHCDAKRVLTVENETTFLELVKLRSNVVLILTSYPGRAALRLLQRLSTDLEFWHFGDSDPAGFDILRDLRVRSGQTIRPLHMRFRAALDAPQLTADERTLLQRSLNLPLMEDCHAELQALQMADSKGMYEQESLGPPTLSEWPFYT